MSVFLIGLPGSGKTTLGKLLAEKLAVPFIDLDEEIEKQSALTIPQIFEQFGEDHFRKLERKVLHMNLRKGVTIVSTGGGTPCFFDNIEQINKHGQSVFIDVSPQEIVRRMLTADSIQNRPLLKDKSDDDLILEIENKRKERLPFYNQCLLHVKGDKLEVHDLEKALNTKNELF